MIEKISHISNLGVFDSFDWDSTVRDHGNRVFLKKLNLIYGRNYSGKTSLSRILRSFEQKEIQERITGANFEIKTTDDTYTQDNVNDHTLNVRVYNKDFIDENLTFLKDETGDIKSFAILGEENVDTEKQIKELETKLGNEEDKIGLYFERSEKKSKYEDKKRERERIAEALENKLRNKANNDIKENSIYENVRYNIRNINDDIDSINSTEHIFLSDEQIEKKKELLKEQPKPDISEQRDNMPDLKDFETKTNALLQKPIKPTKPLQDLISNAVLEEWVRKGMPLHKDERTLCAFCGNLLPSDLWEKLDSHFNKESEDLRNNISDLKVEIDETIEILKDKSTLSKSQFYSQYHNKLEDQNSIFSKALSECVEALNECKNGLTKREKDIFKIREKLTLKDNNEVFSSVIENINSLIKSHNSKTVTLKEDQNLTRNELRLNEIAQFLKDIEYKKELSIISQHQDAEKLLKKEFDSVVEDIQKFEKEIDDLKTMLKDERKGADRVNSYLNHFFGHEGLNLKAFEDEEGTGYKFKVVRGDEPAFNLSEGECSLIAFCYFMAKLEDTESKGKELIIWIDDPVSSLDGNHIFFVFSLIESVLAKKKNYKQLFISTHNLEFLKYLKKLSVPYKRIELEDGTTKKEKDSESFMLERSSESSKLILMPGYLKNYITEFNYLFHQIYKCSKAENLETSHDCFYNFGNNLRKFLEAYLFYKYPVNLDGDASAKLRKFFGEDENSVALTNRVSNELSHLEEIFDRSMRPIDIPEIPKLASFVLNRIKDVDEDQYDALLKSIGEN